MKTGKRRRLESIGEFVEKKLLTKGIYADYNTFAFFGKLFWWCDPIHGGPGCVSLVRFRINVLK